MLINRKFTPSTIFFVFKPFHFIWLISGLLFHCKKKLHFRIEIPMKRATLQRKGCVFLILPHLMELFHAPLARSAVKAVAMKTQQWRLQLGGLRKSQLWLHFIRVAASPHIPSLHILFIHFFDGDWQPHFPTYVWLMEKHFIRMVISSKVTIWL